MPDGCTKSRQSVAVATTVFTLPLPGVVLPG